MRALILAAALAGLAVPSAAETIRLTPASPQPDAAALKPGLSVRYAYPPEVKDLREARHWLDEGAEPGEPLPNLRFKETMEGEPTLTAAQATRVAAEITGFVRFDSAGPMRVEFLSNDGLLVELGGQRISKHDGRHPCESDGYYDVEAPEPGWYEIRLTYFQRLGGACLLMRDGGPEGKLGWVADERFGHMAN